MILGSINSNYINDSLTLREDFFQPYLLDYLSNLLLSRKINMMIWLIINRLDVVMLRILPLILISISFFTNVNYPTSFSNAKSKAEKSVYFDKLTTFYCGCDYVFGDTEDKDADRNKHETMIFPENCGYIPRTPITSTGKDNSRISRIEWEHIMPAHAIGGQLDEWKNKANFSECKKSNGKFISGRDCAYKLNPSFKRAHNDMNNLTPAAGELNGDCSNYPFRNIEGEGRVYGACDFEVDFDTHTAEPPDSVKGNIA